MEILPRLIVSIDKGISRACIYRWLPRLGFYALEVKKGVYINRHKREDIVAYRQGVFLPMMEELGSYCRQYDEQEDGLWKVIEPILPLGINCHVFYYHDESCFHGHDYKKTIWLDSITE
jgi:hypothetical protein